MAVAAKAEMYSLRAVAAAGQVVVSGGQQQLQIGPGCDSGSSAARFSLPVLQLPATCLIGDDFPSYIRHSQFLLLKTRDADRDILPVRKHLPLTNFPSSLAFPGGCEPETSKR